MRIFFSVGEPSGDQHAAHLIEELNRRIPNLETLGYGGPQMEAKGFQCHYPLTNLAVMGILRVLPLIFQFYKLIRQADRILEQEKPDAVVLVDFPGFNWWIARKAKKHGIRVFYYLPPQLWAWAPWRIKRVRKFVDHVLCGLSFEQRWYAERGVSAEFVGHPFFDEIQDHSLDQSFVNRWRADGQRNVAVLPGSRTHEVAQNWPIMVACMRKLAQQHSDVRFLVPCYNEDHLQKCEEILDEEASSKQDLPVQLFVKKAPEVIHVSDCCLMVSGSVSLEILARVTPAVVIYYFGWLSGLMVKLLVTCKYCSLPNLMANRMLLPEFYPQGDGAAVIEQVTNKLSSWLNDEKELNGVRTDLVKLRRQVAETGATSRAAEAIVRHLNHASLSRAA
ncbi:MAG: lipid-A-disaccharide synthase [Planctomycetaceae bacterium]|nr:lipid-A-disaccharide synthase [Planctomycetaceae bacterium]